MTKFNIGDKVVPIKKSTWGVLENSNEWRGAQESNQKFLYINRIHSNGDISCSRKKNMGGDFFLESDLVLYSEELEATDNAQMLISKLETLVIQANTVIDTLKSYNPQEPKTEIVTETNNSKRKQIIDEAKDFVEKYRSVKKGEKSHEIGNTTAQEHYYEADFVAKGNKITALVYHLDFGETKQSNKPNRVGRAKCAPDNVFNKHIGEAIALGRALGINVDKFIDAVQPTVVEEGAIVHYFSDYGGTFTHISNGGRDTETNNKDLNNKTGFGWSCTIKDDTNAQYEGTK